MTMQAEPAIEHAHDVLHFLLTPNAPPVLGEHEREHVCGAHNALA
jgi:hypothetical protein